MTLRAKANNESLSTMTIMQHRLANSRLALSVDAALGGRITEFSVRGRNALTTAAPEIGSTFWPSPQQAWHWPPPAALDRNPYTVLSGGSELCLQSAVCDVTGLQLEKTFRLEEFVAVIGYRLTNQNDQANRWAPWEITRVDGGLSFCRAPTVLLNSSLPVHQLNSCIWHDYRVQNQAGENQKLFANHSGGWLANVHRGLLLVKRFAPIGSADWVAPGEAEVEIYAHGDVLNPYVEIEQQGAYQELQPGQSLVWQVEWFVSELSDEFNCELGSEDLLNAVEALLARA